VKAKKTPENKSGAKQSKSKKAAMIDLDTDTSAVVRYP
jgi:hypothetical protein